MNKQMSSIVLSELKISKRVILRPLSENHIAIVKHVKSRIIQKDAFKIIEIAKQIHSVDSNLKVSLIYSSAICSKSIRLLEEIDIDLIFE